MGMLYEYDDVELESMGLGIPIDTEQRRRAENATLDIEQLRRAAECGACLDSSEE